MSNMSYCRWHNTYLDVEDCFGSFDEGDGMSGDEVSCAKNMVKRMCEFLYDQNVISDYDLDNLFAELDNLNEDKWD